MTSKHIDNMGLNAPSLAILALLRRYADDTGAVSMSLVKIAVECRTTRLSAASNLRYLERAGVLAIEKTPTRRWLNSYTLTALGMKEGGNH